MKRKLPEIILTLTGLVLAALFFAQASSPHLATNQFAGTLPAPANQVEASANALLKSQIETMQRYDDRLLNVVYWSMSGVFLLVVLVGGMNWFTNYRLYEKEKDALGETIRAQASQQSEVLKTQIHEYKSLQESQTEAFKADVLRRLDDQLRVQSKAAEDAAATAVGEIKGQFLEAEMHNIEFRAEYYERTEKHYRAFEAWVGYLEAIKRRNMFFSTFLVGTTLQKLSALLAKTEITYTLHDRLNQVLQNAPAALGGEIEAFRARLDKVHKFN